jgi:hypothetical protein
MARTRRSNPEPGLYHARALLMSEPHVPFEVEVLPVDEASTMLIEVHADNEWPGEMLEPRRSGESQKN